MLLYILLILSKCDINLEKKKSLSKTWGAGQELVPTYLCILRIRKLQEGSCDNSGEQYTCVGVYKQGQVRAPNGGLIISHVNPDRSPSEHLLSPVGSRVHSSLICNSSAKKILRIKNVVKLLPSGNHF